MKEKFKKLFYTYQRVFWYIGMANGEVRKPLFLTNEILLLLTFLTVRGIKVGILEAVVAYIIIMGLLFIGGKLYLMTGAPKYLARIQNEQNPQFLEILTRLKRIEGKLNGKKD